MNKIEVLDKEQLVSPLEMEAGTFGEIVGGRDNTRIVFKTAVGDNLIRLWDLDMWDKEAMKHSPPTMKIRPIPVGSVIKIIVGNSEE